MTSIRINFTNGAAVSADPTFNNNLNDSTLGVKSADLLDIAGASTGVSLEVVAAFTGESGASGTFSAGVDIFPADTFDRYWYMGATPASIVLGDLPASTVIAVKGIGASTTLSRDTVWDIDAQQQTYDAGGGTSAPNPPVNFTTTQSDGSGNLQIDLSRVSVFGYLGALELVFAPASGISIDVDSGNLNLTGGSLSLTKNRLIDLSTGSLLLTGNEIVLTYTPISDISIDLDSGVLSLTGEGLDLKIDKVIDLNTGQISLTGQQLSLIAGKSIDLSKGSLSFTGESLELIKSSILNINTGTVSLTGQALTLAYSGLIVATIDDFSLSYTSDTISLSYTSDSISIDYTIDNIKINYQ